MIIKLLVHFESLPEHMRLMAPALPEALILCSLKVVHQDWLVVWMRCCIDDDAGSLSGRKTTNVGKALFGYDNVQVVLSLIYMCAHWNNA